MTTNQERGKEFIDLVIRDCCEQDPSESEGAIHILPEELELIIRNRLEAWQAALQGGSAKCIGCDGSGMVAYTIGQTPESFEQGEYRCLECNPEPSPDSASDGRDGESDLPPIYYMNENHTFTKLDPEISIAMGQIETAFNAGNVYGMLCSKRKGFQCIHANGNEKRLEFFAECSRALSAAKGEG